LRCEAQLEQAKTLFVLKKYSDGNQTAGRVRKCFESIADTDLAPRLLAELSLEEGKAQLHQSVSRALPLLTNALSFYLEKNYIPRRIEAYVERAKAYSEAGLPVLANRDITAAISEIERQRSKLVLEGWREDYVEALRRVFEELAYIQISGRSASAKVFMTAEMARSGNTTWLDGIAGKSIWRAEGESFSEVSRVQDCLAGKSVIISYFFVRDSLVLWIVGRDRFLMRSIPLNRQYLDQLIGAMHLEANSSHGKMNEDEGEMRDLLASLFDLIIRPAMASVPSGSPLVIIPDSSLYQVPFAALFDRYSGKYLVEQHSIVICPSVALFLRLSTYHRSVRDPGLSALILGDPLYDAKLFPDLPRLRWARREALDLDRMYKDGICLLGKDVTKERWLKLGGNFDVVHFGGHSVYPLGGEPFFLLSPNGEDWRSATLLPSEIEGQKWGRTKLVVLGGCDTSGIGASGAGKAVLAQAFLSAGVQSVVATVWRINDESSSRLLMAFHGEVLRGRDPVDALRSAQLTLIRDPKWSSPIYWAGFQVIGSGLI
jgi:CHAT domain-containing protein